MSVKQEIIRTYPNTRIDTLMKRELFAAMALQGLLAAGKMASTGTATEAVRQADQLIAALSLGAPDDE